MKAEPLLRGLEIGDVEGYRNLSFVRVYGPDKFRESVLTLDEAFETNRVETTGFSVRESGNVPELIVQNDLDMMVFIALGMILEGESQNRAAQYPLLVPGHSGEIHIPVRCAERHQPLEHGTRFVSTTTILIASARTGRTEQNHTWNTISDATTVISRKNKTDDYVTAVKEADLSDYAGVFGKPRKDQLGYIAAIQNNGHIFYYADILGNHELYKKLGERLHESVGAVAKQGKGNSRVERNAFLSFYDSAKPSELREVTLNRLEGNVFVADSPIAVSALLCKESPVQVSLRKDNYTS